tara:strand:- start:1719 stop:2024 length:306 start_codon:yes stop_codon:yes gene_type:complete
MEELEQASINVQRLVERLQKRFPNHDFSQPAPLDKRCKKSTTGVCPVSKHLEYATDTDGNDFCIKQIKLADENNPYAHTIITCNAIIKTKEEKELAKKGIF